MTGRKAHGSGYQRTRPRLCCFGCGWRGAGKAPVAAWVWAHSAIPAPPWAPRKRFCCACKGQWPFVGSCAAGSRTLVGTYGLTGHCEPVSPNSHPRSPPPRCCSLATRSRQSHFLDTGRTSTWHASCGNGTRTPVLRCIPRAAQRHCKGPRVTHNRPLCLMKKQRRD